MDLKKYKDMVDEIVIEPMISFMEEWEDCDYTAEDVEICKSLVYTYLEALAAMAESGDEAILEQVKTLVLALNDLNEKADYSLIETDAREALCEVIRTGAVDCGLKEYSEDITEEWREW